MTSITYPISVTSMDGGVFSDCRGLTSVTFPEGITSISSNAFNGCTGLKSVSIPNSITSIEMYAFSGCKNLNDFYCYRENCPETQTNVFKDAYIESATLHVPNESIELYKEHEVWGKFGKIVPLTDDEITVIVEINANEDVCQIFTLDGRLVETLQKGVNIIRYSDGTTKSVYVE